jgi:hypothetical protein
MNLFISVLGVIRELVGKCKSITEKPGGIEKDLKSFSDLIEKYGILYALITDSKLGIV